MLLETVHEADYGQDGLEAQLCLGCFLAELRTAPECHRHLPEQKPGAENFNSRQLASNHLSHHDLWTFGI